MVRQGREVRLADLHVEVPRVAQHGAVLHQLEMLFAEHVDVARQGQEDIPDPGRLLHAHHVEAVHQGLAGLVRIDLRHDHPGAQSGRPHGDAPPAPAVADHDDRLARHHHVRGADEAVPHRLSRPVTVVEQVLAERVVDRDHGELQNALVRHGPQALDAGGRLLRSSQDARDQLRHLLVDRGHEVGPVVHDDVRLIPQDGAHVTEVLLRGHAPVAVDVHALVREGRTDVVLSGQRIAAAGGDRRPQMGEGQQQIGRLRLQMKAGGDRRPLEGLSLLVLVVQELERRHVLPSPHDLVPAVLRQLHVRNVILLQNDPSKVENPDKNSMGASPPSPHPGDLSPGNPESKKLLKKNCRGGGRPPARSRWPQYSGPGSRRRPGSRSSRHRARAARWADRASPPPTAPRSECPIRRPR